MDEFWRKHAHVVLLGNLNKNSIMIAADSTIIDCKLAVVHMGDGVA